MFYVLHPRTYQPPRALEHDAVFLFRRSWTCVRCNVLNGFCTTSSPEGIYINSYFLQYSLNNLRAGLLATYKARKGEQTRQTSRIKAGYTGKVTG